MRVFLHRVKSGGFQYALLRGNDVRVNPEAEKPTPNDKFSWRNDVVCPWRDLVKLIPELDFVSDVGAIHLDRMTWGMQNPVFLYRYPVVRSAPHAEGFIPCEDPPYLFARHFLPPDCIKPSGSVGFTGTTLAAATFSRQPWEALFPQFRLADGAGPIPLCARFEYA